MTKDRLASTVNVNLNQSVSEDNSQNYRFIFEHAAIGIYTTSIDRRFVTANQKCCDILGYALDELLGKSVAEFIHPDDRSLADDTVQNLLCGKNLSVSFSRRNIKKDGTIVWTSITSSIMCDDDGNPLGFIVTMQDISELQSPAGIKRGKEKYTQLYTEYSNNQSLLRCLIDSMPNIISFKDKDGIFLGCNKAYENFIGCKESEIIGQYSYDLLDKKTTTNSRVLDAQVLETQQPVQIEEVIVSASGIRIPVETLKSPYYNDNDELIGVISVGTNISERKKKEEEIRFLYYHDVLTNLYNKAFFDEEIRRLNSLNQLSMSVIFGDVNGLKLINDAFGHNEGDKLLIETAKILLKCTRKEDIIARVGGDEFCILLPNTGNEEAENVIKRIKKECESHAIMSICSFSISLGCATKADESQDVPFLIEKAEDLMYMHKLLEQKSVHSSILSTIKATLSERSYETEAHAERMTTLAKKVSKKMGIPNELFDQLELLGILHDVGKIGIRDNILKKSGSLTEAEWEEMKKHSEIGARIASAIPEIRAISDYILYHHERWDGKGYPAGLSGEAIPLLSRIIAVVDSYDAMTSDRAYRKAMPKNVAINEIRANAGTQFDPHIAEIFLQTIE